MKRWDIINALIKKYGYSYYLEIGLDEGNQRNDEKVNAKFKLSVDPATGSRATHNMTSDKFFEFNRENFDIIFIDGLHHCDQVERDIRNSLRFLFAGGTIVVHDCNPTTEAMQAVPRIQGEWTGDVWKAFIWFRQFADLEMFVIDTDYGVGIIRNGTQKRLNLEGKKINYNEFSIHKKEWLNLIPVEEAHNYL